KSKMTVAAWQRPSIFLLAGIGLLLLGLLVGVYLFFPTATLKQRVIQEVETRTGAGLQIEQLSLYPPLSLDARGITLDLKGLPQPLLIQGLSLSPQWSTLLTSNPGLHLQGHLMNGTITAGVLKSGEIDAVAAGLQFDLPLQKPLPLTINGTLDDATVAGSTRLDQETVTSMTLHLSEVSIHGLELLGADSRGIVLGEISLETEGLGRAMKVKTLSATGGDLIVNGEGTLFIGRTAASSRIKLALQVRPGTNLNPSIASLLELAGKADDEGVYLLQLTGTLTKPLLKSGG
ncbi:MAG: type II secretion system protein GspN, partial [Desulfuromonadales bacterium]